MRYHTLFYASLLQTAVFAQSSVTFPSGAAHHSGVLLGGNSTHGHNSTHPILPVTANASSPDVKHHQPTGFSTGLPPKQSANATGVYNTAFDRSKHSSAARKPHQPYTKPVGPLFVNYTVSHPGPTGTVGVAQSGSGISGGFEKPTGTGSIPSAYNVKPIASSAGRLPVPVTKGSGSHFMNSTVVIPSQARTETPHVDTVVSSGFAQPTASQSHTDVLANSTSTSGRVPFTKSNRFHFANSTSPLAMPTGSGHVRPTGLSSGFAKPTVASHYTVSAPNSSTTASTSARLPFTKSNGFHFANSTSGMRSATGTGASGFLRPTISRIVFEFPTASEHPSYTKSSRPQSNSTSTRSQFQSGSFSTGVYSSGALSAIISTATAIPTPSGHHPYTKSTGFVFSISTSTNSATGTGVLSTKPLATAPSSAGAMSTGALSMGLPTQIISAEAAPPYSKPTTALFVNSTSGIAPTESFSTRISATGTSTPITITESSPSVPTSSASSTQSVKILASTSFGLNSTTSASGYLSTGAVTSTIASVSTTMITKAPLTSVIASTRFVVSTSSHASPSHVIIPQYYQCGGINFKGTGACAKGSVCKKWNPYYHQCVDERYA